MAVVDRPEPTVEPGDFVRDTALRPVDGVPGRYEGFIPEAWKVVYAFGGVSMAVAVRGIQEELVAQRGDDDLHLISANATYVTPLPCGPVELDATVLRNGRTGAQGLATLRAGGSTEPAIVATAVFGERLDQPIGYVDVPFPDGAGQPLDHPVPVQTRLGEEFPRLNFHEQTEWRPAIGNRWWEADSWEADGSAGTPPDGTGWSDQGPGTARFGAWQRLAVPARRPDGTLDPLALCVPADMVGPGVGQKVGPPTEEVSHFFVLTLELGMQLLADPVSEWVLQVCHSQHAGDGYATGSVELWDDEQRLLAVGHQRARIRIFSLGDGFLP